MAFVTPGLWCVRAQAESTPLPKSAQNQLVAWRMKRFKSTKALVSWELHPSRECVAPGLPRYLCSPLTACRGRIHSYVLLLAQDGTLLVYHVWLEELRGVIPTLPPTVVSSLRAAQRTSRRLAVGAMSVDPTGLYVDHPYPITARACVLTSLPWCDLFSLVRASVVQLCCRGHDWCSLDASHESCSGTTTQWLHSGSTP